MSKKFLFSAILVGLLLAGCGDSQSEIDNASRHLEEKCLALTENNDEGRIYQAYIGQANYKRTHFYLENSRQGSFVGTILTLNINGNDALIYGKKAESDEKHKKYIDAFKATLFSVSKKRNKHRYIWGVCAYKNEHEQLFDDIETLTKIGVK